MTQGLCYTVLLHSESYAAQEMGSISVFILYIKLSIKQPGSQSIADTHVALMQFVEYTPRLT